MQSLLEKGRDLDSALASQLINPTQWQEARTRLSDEIAALEKEMADSAVGQMFIPFLCMSNPIVLSPRLPSAHNGLEEMARQFQESGEKSSKAMVDMVNNSLHALNELQSAISSGGILGILSAGFNAFGSVSQPGLLGKGLQGTFKDFSGLPGFATGGRSADHTSETPSIMRISYAVFCLKKKKTNTTRYHNHTTNNNN